MHALWHLDDGMLGHTCYDDGFLDDDVVDTLAWHACLDLEVKCIPLAKGPWSLMKPLRLVVNLINYDQQHLNVDILW